VQTITATGCSALRPLATASSDILPLVGLGGRPFTFFSVDGSIMVNIGLGTVFDDPTGSTSGSCGTAARQKGELFIHEMTHAWEIAHSLTEGYICDAVTAKVGEVTVGQSRIYSYGGADTDWDDFNMEQKASVVEEWYAGATCRMRVPQSNRNSADARDPYFHYIQNDIRTGQQP